MSILRDAKICVHLHIFFMQKVYGILTIKLLCLNGRNYNSIEIPLVLI